MTLLADIVTASSEVTNTSSRSRKIAILAELLRSVDAGEVAACVGFLSGSPRQGRVGVSYRTLHGIDASAAPEPSLTVLEVVTRSPKSSARPGAARP